MSFTLILWLFTIGVLLHNLEEAIWLPFWEQQYRPKPRVTIFGFRFAAVVVSLVFVIVALLATVAEPQSPALYAACGLMGVMVLNAVFPHMALAVVRNSYMPGLASAIFMVLPLGLLGLWRAIQFDFVEPWPLALVIAGLVVLSVPALFGLFRLGDWLRGFLR